MRWLLLKDLRILRRSPLMVALLVIYPIVIAVLIGFALSRGPDKPKVAFYNGLSVSASTIELGGHKLNLADEEGALFKDIDVVKVDSPEAVRQKVRDGDVLAGIVIPKDLASNLQSTLESGKLQVFYNSEDPAKQAYVENTIEAQVKAANASLTKRIAEEALNLLNLIGDGGVYHFLGQDFDVLGLKRAQTILNDTRANLTPAKREQLDEVIDFTDLARDNLSFSDDVLNVVGEPIKVSSKSLSGGRTSLDEFAVALAASVSLMFISLLLAFMLALPLAFLALVPSGAVAPALYDVIRAVSAVFPFKPTLDALDAALNDAGGLGGALAHLAALALAFGVLSRLALRRFAA